MSGNANLVMWGGALLGCPISSIVVQGPCGHQGEKYKQLGMSMARQKSRMMRRKALADAMMERSDGAGWKNRTEEQHQGHSQ